MTVVVTVSVRGRAVFLVNDAAVATLSKNALAIERAKVSEIVSASENVRLSEEMCANVAVDVTDSESVRPRERVRLAVVVRASFKRFAVVRRNVSDTATASENVACVPEMAANVSDKYALIFGHR